MLSSSVKAPFRLLVMKILFRKISFLILFTAVAFSQIFAQANSSQKIQRYKLEESIENVKIGETEIKIVSYKTSKSKPIYFRPHENETTSSIAVKEVLARRGGTLVELKSKGERFIKFLLKQKNFSFDPNRIFSPKGIEKTLGSTSIEAQIAVTEFVEKLFSDHLTSKKLIIAVHNNTDGAPLSMETYQKADKSEIADFAINPIRDADDFFYVTDENFFEFLKKKGFNVALQNNQTVEDDGSLSVYCGKQGIPYVNVEAQSGHLREQIEMLEALQELFDK